MFVVEFTGPEEIQHLKIMLAVIIENATYNVRLAVDVDGFKASIDRGVWSPGYGTPTPPTW